MLPRLWTSTRRHLEREIVGVHKTPDGKVMHAELRVGDARLMLADEFPGMGCRLAQDAGRQPRGTESVRRKTSTACSTRRWRGCDRDHAAGEPVLGRPLRSDQRSRSATSGRWDSTSKTLRPTRWSAAPKRPSPQMANANSLLNRNIQRSHQLGSKPSSRGGFPNQSSLEDLMSNSQATHHDAELILKLYDLRREPVMREARNFVFGFAPKSVDDVLAVISDFSAPRKTPTCARSFGYWEMVASLVVHGTLNAVLAYDTFQRNVFRVCQDQPFLAEVRQKYRHAPEFLEQRAEVGGRLAGRPRNGWRACRSGRGCAGRRRPAPEAPSSDIRECRDRCSAAARRRSLRR